jgi:hypothetical protein
VEQAPEDIEDPGVFAEYHLDLALEAHGAGASNAAELAVDAAQRVFESATTSVDVWPYWLFAAEVVCELRDQDGLAGALSLADRHDGPRPVGVRMQYLRVTALANEVGSVPAADVEADYREALAAARAWGSPVYEARVGADLGVWLLGQGRQGEAGDLLAAARATYERLGARQWLDVLDDRTLGPDRTA